jgi:hypothetical protein
MAVLSSHTSMPCNIHTGHSLQTARRRKVYWPAVRVPKGQPNLASTGRPFLSYRLARHHASTADGFTGGDSLQGLNRVGPEICPLFGLTNLISLINLYYYRRHHIIVLDQVCLSCPPPGPVSNDALHRRGEGIHWPHERST